jgi:hypothetical protein
MRTRFGQSSARRAGNRKQVVLSGPQRVALLAKLHAYGPTRQVDARGRSLGARGRIWLDLPDLMEAMPSSGVRIGKVLAVFGPNVEPAAPTVAVTHLWSVFLAPGSTASAEKGERRRLAAGSPAMVGADVAAAQSRRATARWSFSGELLDPSNLSTASPKP